MKQSSCEMSTFGSEFVVMKQAPEYIHGLRYTLGMMGITVDEQAYMYLVTTKWHWLTQPPLDQH